MFLIVDCCNIDFLFYEFLEVEMFFKMEWYVVYDCGSVIVMFDSVEVIVGKYF